jgi:dihydroxycyclohexadiene carboxylate dehydrogenase
VGSSWKAEAIEQVTQSSFLKHYGIVAEQVSPMLFLISEKTFYITGSILPGAGSDID